MESIRIYAGVYTGFPHQRYGFTNVLHSHQFTNNIDVGS